MRICFVGGGASYSQPLDTTNAKKFQALLRLGKLFVIGFGQDWRAHYFTEHACFYLLPRVPLPLLRYAEMFTFGPLVVLWCILRHDVQILVAQSPYEGFSAGLAKVLARLFGRRVALIVESHGDFEVSIFVQRRVLLPWFYRFSMRQAARFAFHNSDALRCISKSTRKQLESWAPGKPIVQFPTWTDMDTFLEAGAKKEQDRKERIVLYVGALIPRKGIHFLLDAFARITGEVPDAKLWLIGKAENAAYARALKDESKRLGLDGRVMFLDPIPQHNLAEYMATAEVLVLPSISEGLGRVVFEAMACGTPVIGSHVGGIAEMIVNGETGFLVQPGEVSSLTERLRWILQHPQETHELGQRARKFARAFFSQEAYVENYARLFELASQTVENHT